MALIRCPRPPPTPFPPLAFPRRLLPTPPPGPAPPLPPPSGLDRGWYVPHVSWVLVWPATRVPCGQTLPGVRANYQRRGAGASVGACVCVCVQESERGGRGDQLLHTFNTALKRERERETGDAQIPPRSLKATVPQIIEQDPPKKRNRGKRTAVEHGRRNSSFARETVTGT